MLLRIEPISEALTTSNCCARTSRMAMISSVMLPNVALRRPPTRGPARIASWSVARPMRAARGMIAREERTNTTTGWGTTNWATNDRGTKISSQYTDGFGITDRIVARLCAGLRSRTPVSMRAVPYVPALEVVLIDVRDRIATVTLNRPEQRNPLSAGMLRDLRTALAWCAGEQEVRVVVLTGAGDRAFCAGADLGSFAGVSSEVERHHERHGFVDLFLLMQDLGKPI